MRNYALTAAFIVASAVGVVHPVDAHAAPTSSTSSCSPVDVSRMPLEQVAELMDAGWQGDPGDGQEALYAPECDLPDSWPMGAGTYAAAALAYGLLDAAAPSVAFTADGLDTGWTLLPAGTILDPNGVDRGPCLAQVGDTTLVSCLDGFTTTS